MRADHWWTEHDALVKEWLTCAIAALLVCVVLVRCYDHWNTTWRHRARRLLRRLGRQVPSLSVDWGAVEEDDRGHVLIWLDFDPTQDAVALDAFRGLPSTASLQSMAFDGAHRRLCLRLRKRQSMCSILWTVALAASIVALAFWEASGGSRLILISDG